MSIFDFARDDCIMPAEVAQRVIAGTITAPRKRPASVWQRTFSLYGPLIPLAWMLGVLIGAYYVVYR